MHIILTLVTIAQVISALAVIFLVLIQHGKGADMGAAFGSGASGSLFGATGSANFLSRLTAVMATIFLASTLALAYIATNKPKSASTGVMENIVPAQSMPAAVPQAVPAQSQPTTAPQPAPSSEIPK